VLTGLPWEIIERDYALSWILAGVSTSEKLRNSLIFKGGTALKKCYFGDYRFSEDLDFTATKDAPSQDALEEQVHHICSSAADLSGEFSPIEFAAERYIEKMPHPGSQEAFSIRGKFPWHRQFMVRVMIEVTFDEPVKREPVRKKIIHGYGETISHEVLVYSLEEIIAEKLRAILQHLRKLEERGWSRSRARDYYDIWRIMNYYQAELHLETIPGLFLEKCKVRDISFQGPQVFFEGVMLDYIEKTWEQWLGPLVPKLPPFEQVIGDLRQRIYDLFR